jgi:hypothetical protein
VLSKVIPESHAVVVISMSFVRRLTECALSELFGAVTHYADTSGTYGSYSPPMQQLDGSHISGKIAGSTVAALQYFVMDAGFGYARLRPQSSHEQTLIPLLSPRLYYRTHGAPMADNCKANRCSIKATSYLAYLSASLCMSERYSYITVGGNRVSQNG